MANTNDITLNLPASRLTRIHDAVAQGYNSQGGIIGRKNDTVLHMLAQRLQDHGSRSSSTAGSGDAGSPLDVLDLGVGDAALLSQLQQLPHPLRFTGLDISPAMLAAASARLPLKAVLAPAQDAEHHLQTQSFDWVLAHFILAYVPLRDVLQQAHKLLKPGGVLSLVSSTHLGTSPLLAANRRCFELSPWPWMRWTGRAIDRAVQASHVPRSLDDIEQACLAQGMRLERSHTLRDPICFENVHDAYRFFITEGWGVNILAQCPHWPAPLTKAMLLWGLRQYRYPICWVHTTEVLEITVSA